MAPLQDPMTSVPLFGLLAQGYSAGLVALACVAVLCCCTGIALLVAGQTSGVVSILCGVSCGALLASSFMRGTATNKSEMATLRRLNTEFTPKDSA